MRQVLRGFTLIELLIVVAIIAILAAIAVPNFLEAQTRSKVSRVHNDTRALATAFESYYVDTNRYPACQLMRTGTDPVDNPTRAFMNLQSNTPWAYSIVSGYWPTLITTPVAYMTSLPYDPFPTNLWGEPFNTPPPRTVAPPNLGRHYFVWVFPRGKLAVINNNMGINYILASPGPDQAMGLGMEWEDNGLYLNCRYDPTNGTVSGGNVTRFGPSNSTAYARSP